MEWREWRRELVNTTAFICQPHGPMTKETSRKDSAGREGKPIAVGRAGQRETETEKNKEIVTERERLRRQRQMRELDRDRGYTERSRQINVGQRQRILRETESDERVEQR